MTPEQLMELQSMRAELKAVTHSDYLAIDIAGPKRRIDGIETNVLILGGRIDYLEQRLHQAIAVIDSLRVVGSSP